MKRFLCFFAVAALASACNSGKDDAKVQSMSATDSTKNEEMAVTYPYDVQYSSKFEIGDPNQAKIILDLWKNWDNGTLANSRDNFADSVDMHFSSGYRMHASRDSVIAAGQKERDGLSKAVSTVDAVTPLKSTDKNENWVTVWGKEVDTHKDGKVDSTFLQETWRFNKDGKVDLLYQYAAKPMPDKKM